MPTNPIQRKSRNSFFLGMTVMLIILIIIGAVLYFTFFHEDTTITQKGETVYAYKLIKSIKSGENLTEDAIEKVKVSTNEVPLNFINANTTTLSSQLISKINLETGTILTPAFFYTQDKDITDKSLRLAEFNMITFPSTLKVGDYIDLRITFPNGLDYIIISKKRVISINNTTLGLYLTEDEILTMNCAIIESYIITASNIYAIQYVEPGLQEEATPTYPVNKGVYALAQTNPNILNSIKSAMQSRYESTGDALRKNYIDPQLANYMNRLTTEKPAYLQDVETQLQEQIETAREAYLSGLAGY